MSYPKSQTVRIVLQSLGFISLGLGFAGAFLPLLPTTPFILISGWCFAKSSPKWDAYIRNHREFGPLIRNWQNGRSVSKKHKLTAVAMIAVSVLGAWLTDRSMTFKVSLTIGLLTILSCLLLTKTSSSDSDV